SFKPAPITRIMVEFLSPISQYALSQRSARSQKNTPPSQTAQDGHRRSYWRPCRFLGGDDSRYERTCADCSSKMSASHNCESCSRYIRDNRCSRSIPLAGRPKQRRNKGMDRRRAEMHGSCAVTLVRPCGNCKTNQRIAADRHPKHANGTWWALLLHKASRERRPWKNSCSQRGKRP